MTILVSNNVILNITNMFKSTSAEEGKDVANISGIEQKFPTIYKNGKLWKWLDENDIHCSGSADNNGKNACYSFWWQ